LVRPPTSTQPSGATESQLRALYSRASIYAATARYEPLGMPLLEAAFSRCAIVANDIPSFREIWGDAALYFRTNDASSLGGGDDNKWKCGRASRPTEPRLRRLRPNH
jgi:glycosyltransferase involved in cell wall biosynthesis